MTYENERDPRPYRWVRITALLAVLLLPPAWILGIVAMRHGARCPAYVGCSAVFDRELAILEVLLVGAVPAALLLLIAAWLLPPLNKYWLPRTFLCGLVLLLPPLLVLQALSLPLP